MNTNFEKTPVAQAMAKRLQDMIRSGELKVGERIPSQRVLAERFNVSRPTLREALLTLETLGLIHTLPARGTFVADPETNIRAPARWRFEDHSLLDVFQSRILIEGELARLAAPHIDAEALGALQSAAAEFESAWTRGDLVAHVEADLAFHSAIAQACPNLMLRRLYQSVQDLLTESQRQPIPNTARARMVQSIAEHSAILAALAEGDGKAAERAMRLHISNTALSAGVTLS